MLKKIERAVLLWAGLRLASGRLLSMPPLLLAPGFELLRIFW
jgi:hypothetical protein